MKKKKQDENSKKETPSKVIRTVSNEEIKKMYDKIVKTHGETLKRLSKH